MTEMTLQQTMELAISHLQAGRLGEAEDIYRQILEQQPDQPDALRFMGIVQFQSAKIESALELLQRSIAIKPSADCYDNLGHVFASLGRMDEAAAAFQEVVNLNRNSADAYVNLGTALLALEKLDQAIDVYRIALTIRSDTPETLNNLGIALVRRGKSDQAIPYLRQAIALWPDFVEAHCNYALALRDTGKFDQAIEKFQRALTLRPHQTDAALNLADTFRQAGHMDEAIALARKTMQDNPNSADVIDSVGVLFQTCEQFTEAAEAHRRAVAVNPDSAEAHYNLGTALRGLGKDEQAAEEFRQAIRLRPDLAQAHNNLGSALMDLGQYDQALNSIRSALAISPNLPAAHFNLGVVLLTRGDLARGFEEFDWRWQTPELSLSQRQFPQPRWTGEALHGRTILLHAEQGFGDTLQFIRYLSLVADRGGRIILGCQQELARLLSQFRQVGQIVTQGQALPAFDVHCPLLSLPLVFGTTLENIPSKVPYLNAEPNSAVELPPTSDLKVGICWAGRSSHKRNLSRSIPVSSLAGLADVPGVQFHSLQTGESVDQCSQFPGLTDWSSRLIDFADTASLIRNLDLVITVDTSIAHLAGAMGKPVWVLLSRVADWRWMLDREDSPWYPTMRLFRQAGAGQWDGPIRRVVESLKRFRDER